MRLLSRRCSATVAIALFLAPFTPAFAASFQTFRAKPPLHRFKAAGTAPSGLSPAEVKAAYGLPADGGSGTIAIIDAYDAPTIENDLKVFDAQYGLPPCTKKNGCLAIRKMKPKLKTDSGWSLEAALDVEWAHAIAPGAKILLVEAASAGGKDLLAAVDAARSRSGVVAVSMSWGGPEFPEETSLDGHFAGGASFFAASGDNGTGVSWPAAAPGVIGVGGTTLHLSPSGDFNSETAWSGSGGGVSAYEPQPDFQQNYGITHANGMRAVPDVSYEADPRTGFSVYKSSRSSRGGWEVLGGTSAGAPQWAAIQALGRSATNENFYRDKTTDAASTVFRDITSGKNGDCRYFCRARKRYNEITGLGSPLTADF